MFRDLQAYHVVKSVVGEVGLYCLLVKSKMAWRHPDHVTEWRWHWFLVKAPEGMVPMTSSQGKSGNLPKWKLAEREVIVNRYSNLAEGAQTVQS